MTLVILCILALFAWTAYKAIERRESFNFGCIVLVLLLIFTWACIIGGVFMVYHGLTRGPW